MKTTIEISDGLLADAKKLAAREGVTLRDVVERALRQMVREKKRNSTFRLRDASFGGDGLAPDLEGASWDRLRELAYEGRGG